MPDIEFDDDDNDSIFNSKEEEDQEEERVVKSKVATNSKTTNKPASTPEENASIDFDEAAIDDVLGEDSFESKDPTPQQSSSKVRSHAASDKSAPVASPPGPSGTTPSNAPGYATASTPNTPDKSIDITGDDDDLFKSEDLEDPSSKPTNKSSTTIRGPPSNNPSFKSMAAKEQQGSAPKTNGAGATGGTGASPVASKPSSKAASVQLSGDGDEDDDIFKSTTGASMSGLEDTARTPTARPTPSRPPSATPSMKRMASATTTPPEQQELQQTTPRSDSRSGTAPANVSGGAAHRSSGVSGASTPSRPSRLSIPGEPVPSVSPAVSMQKGVAVDLGTGKEKASSAMPADVRARLDANHRKKEAPQEPKRPPPTAAEMDALDYEDKRTGLELPSPLQLFLQYDTDKSGGISRDELGRMLCDLDGLAGVPQKKRDEYVDQQFDKADLNHDGLISIDEFYLYFYSQLCFKFPVLRTGVNPGADLLNIYIKYCSLGMTTRCEEMQSHQFAKLCSDSKLINGTTVSKAAIDIIYCRARAETNTLEAFKAKQYGKYITPKMLYPQFLFALTYLADKRKSGFQEVVSRILENVSALPLPSNADLLIFRNTGDKEQLEEFLERPRGLPKLPTSGNDAAERLRKEAELAKSLKLAPAPVKLHSHGEDEECDLEDDGDDHEEEGGGTGRTPAVRSGRGNTRYAGVRESADTASRGTRTPSPPPTRQPAVGRALPGEALDPSRLHEGETMADALGGKTTVRVSASGSLPPGVAPVSVLDAYNQTASVAASKVDMPKQWGLGDFGAVTLPRTGQAALTHPESLMAVRKLNPDTLMMNVKRVFEMYNLWENGTNKSAMDKMRFCKAVRDIKIISEQPSGLSTTKVDDIFYRVLGQAKATINFVEFLDALRHIATTLRCTLNEVMERLVLVGGPIPGGL
mmetsp:Transcript_27365/g.59862  ORF Transcript_27365/g.59862 Transcript_27365/m.59862 type:complete len:924 (-) Transcript_27365:761-3532(-)|eukprot:CAMPEP_0202911856 /NCGR_PEP_ID=MMETSP1392-20130828/56097_1 /ASSEMBLY_ACC=CAM_ASM_000868 /TAXON_ID=225041 /ORGANISM="Chlamydomonas chlamydogama, Strain SAG 11-48b" /LENGTH=923 /DNA_ID=CAMNT_0049602529 /DNA_START=156 /DNA_END=2927 /DNA_ORIENTATION=+